MMCVMFKLFRKTEQAPAPIGTVPEGLRYYAIGDVHGRLDLLDSLLALIDDDDRKRGAAAPQLVFLGDLIDRGPDSAGVIERTIQITEDVPSTRVLMGNHEEVFLKVLQGDERALRLFCRIGGRETILSYGISEDRFNQLDYPALLNLLIKTVPDRHRIFLFSLQDMVIAGDYAFVHAGVRPDIALDAQKLSDLRWIREGFLDHPRPFEKIIVHGHSISEEVETRANRIGIDTGAYASGRLTALGLEGSDRWTLST